jgi:hypothetical protein
MGGENKSRTFWDFINFVYEYCSALFQTSDHVLVVNDFLANIDWSSVVI